VASVVTCIAVAVTMGRGVLMVAIGGMSVSVHWCRVGSVADEWRVCWGDVRSGVLHGNVVDRARRDRLAECRVDRGERRLRGLGAGLVGLDGGTEAELVSDVLHRSVTAVDLSEVVRTDDMTVRALLRTTVHVAPIVLDVIAEGVVSEIILLAVVR